MVNDDQLAAHDEATAPKTPAEIASETPFEQINGDLNRKVLNEIAKQQGITADALNISPTKFKKLRNDQLADYIKAGKPQPAAAAKDDQAAADDFDVLKFGSSLYTLVLDAQDSKAERPYEKLDGFIMGNVMERITKGDSKINITTNPQLLTNLLLTGGIVYGLARVVGFEKIKTAAINAKNKIIHGGTPINEPSNNK